MEPVQEQRITRRGEVRSRGEREVSTTFTLITGRDHIMYDQTPKTADERRTQWANVEASTKRHRIEMGLPVDAVYEEDNEVTDPIRAAELVSERHGSQIAADRRRTCVDDLRRPLFEKAEALATINPYRDIDAEAELVGYRDLLNAGIVAINSAISAMETYWRFGGDPQVVEFLEGLHVREVVEPGLDSICTIRDAIDRKVLVHDQIVLEDRLRDEYGEKTELERAMDRPS